MMKFLRYKRKLIAVSPALDTYSLISVSLFSTGPALQSAIWAFLHSGPVAIEDTFKFAIQTPL